MYAKHDGAPAGFVMHFYSLDPTSSIELEQDNYKKCRPRVNTDYDEVVDNEETTYCCGRGQVSGGGN